MRPARKFCAFGLSALPVNGENILRDESLHLGFRQFPAKCVFLDVAGEIGPAQPILLIVIMVQLPEDLDRLSVRQRHFHFVGGGMNILGVPEECNFISPEPVQDFLGSLGVLQRRFERLNHGFDDVVSHAC